MAHSPQRYPLHPLLARDQRVRHISILLWSQHEHHIERLLVHYIHKQAKSHRRHFGYAQWCKHNKQYSLFASKLCKCIIRLQTSLRARNYLLFTRRIHFVRSDPKTAVHSDCNCDALHYHSIRLVVRLVPRQNLFSRSINMWQLYSTRTIP